MTQEQAKIKIIRELEQIAFADIRNIFDKNNCLRNIVELREEILSAIESVEVVKKSVKGEDFEVIKYKFRDKTQALKTLIEFYKLSDLIKLPDNEIKITILTPD